MSTDFTDRTAARRDRIGPYALVEPIGHGGMGVVYRAVREETGARVALKTVRVANVEMLGGVRREILALARLDHPGVVRILDQGLDDGLPWYAMTLLDGVSLRDRIRPSRPRSMHSLTTGYDSGVAVPGVNTSVDPPAAEAEPASRDEVETGLRVLQRLCRTLAYLHGEGVVHLDLKPENVFVTADDLPVLVDFGLAARFAGGRGRDTLGLGTAGSGTIAYMAPEQIVGGEVDARADLYAVGCMLFELLTGRGPFLGHGAALAASHLGRPPVAPSSLVDGVAPELDALVLALLAKDPADRIGYAADVATALARLGGEAEMPGPKSRPYVYRAGFAGRETARSAIHRDLARLARGAGRIVLVGGESGVGKTRLASEIAREIDRDDVLVLLGDCDPHGVASAGAAPAGAAGPLNGLREPLREIADRCREAGEHEVDRVFGARARVLADYEPVLGALPGIERHPDPAPLDADAARLRVFAYLADVFAAVAAETPVLLVLDDMQWADELTLGFLQYLARGGRLDSTPLAVLATYRDDEAGPEIAALAESPDVARVDLGRLGATEVSKIVGGMLALSPPPERLCRELHRASEGNPFFVTEYLRTAVERGLLRRDEARSWRVDVDEETAASIELAVPSSLRELVARRLDDLSPAASDLLRAAAVFGRSVSLRLLLLATRRSETETLEAVTELVRRHAIREARPGELEFTHDKIREAAYERIPGEERPALHRAAAEALESEGADDHAATSAGHWELAGETARARAAYATAARRARGAYANAEAERLYRAVLRLAADAAESVADRNELGALLSFVGRSEEARAEHEIALDAARGAGDRRAEAESLRHLGMLAHDAGRREDADAALAAALDLARAAGDRRLEGAILGDLGAVAFYGGSPERAVAVGTDAIEAHREVGDHSAAAHQLFRVAQARWKLGQVAEAEGLLDDALGHLAGLGDLAGEARVASMRATIRCVAGENEEALRLFGRALELYAEAGARQSEGLALTNIATVMASFGDRAGALRNFDEALAKYRECGSRIQESMALSNKAILLHRLGRYDEACEMGLAALAMHREIGNEVYEAGALSNYGDVLFDMGRLDEAAEAFERALAMHRTCGDRHHEGSTLTRIGRLAGALGRIEEARARYAEALDLLRAAGAGGTEPFALCELVDIELRADPAAVPSSEPVEQSLEAAREQGVIQAEGIALRLLATIARRSGGDLVEATARVERALEIARRIDDPADEVDALCELARIAAARGLPARDHVEAATAIVERLGVRPLAPTAVEVERLTTEIGPRMNTDRHGSDSRDTEE